MSDIIQNAIRTPDGTVLRSHNRHNFITYTDTLTQQDYIVDGGIDYLRRGGGPDATEMSIFITDPHEAVRTVTHLISEKALKDEDTETLKTVRHYSWPPQIRKAIENELEYRA